MERTQRPSLVSLGYRVGDPSPRQKTALRKAAQAQAFRKKGYTIREIMSELGRSKRMVEYYLRVDLNASMMKAIEEIREERTNLTPPPIEIKEDIDAVSFCEDPAYL
ncbi:unnamed protein product, partial [marine sediment metagenome]